MFQRWTLNGATGGGNSRTRHGQGIPKTAVNGWVFLVGSLNGGRGSARKALVVERKERRRSIDRIQLAQDASTTDTIPFIKWRRLHETCHYKNGRSSVLGFGSLCTARAPHRFLAATTASTMDTKSSKQQKRPENALSLLDVAIGVLNLAKDVCGIPPAQAVFGSVSILLTMIRVRFPPLSDDIF